MVYLLFTRQPWQHFDDINSRRPGHWVSK